MKTINDLKALVETMQEDLNRALQKRIQLETDMFFSNSETLKRAIARLLDSDDYERTDYGDIVRTCPFPEFEEFRCLEEFLSEYLAQDGIYVDYVNGRLLENCGESIVIKRKSEFYGSIKS